MLKNVAGQKWEVFAFDATTGLPVTGDAANITANLRKDWGSAVAVYDTNPTETEDGNYLFDLIQSETNGDVLSFYPESSTPNVVVIARPSPVYTTVGGTGSGARTVAVTVYEIVGAAEIAIENASVRFTEGVNTYIGQTNASGKIVFSLDDATYAVAISKPGYSFTPTTLVVDDDKAEPYYMIAVTISAPPNASTTTGVMTVYDEEGSVESGVPISVQILAGPGTDGIGYDSTVWTETSSALGVVEFAGIIKGARYKIWRGSSKSAAQTFTAPSLGVSFDLAEVIGRE